MALLRRKDNPEARMSLGDHFREFRRRALVAVLAILIAAIVGWVKFDVLYEWLVGPIKDLQTQRHNENINLNWGGKGVTGAFNVKLKVSMWVGLILASPVWLWQIWGFLAPGLTKKEKRISRLVVAAAVPLFLLGCWVSTFALPNAVRFLLGVTPGDAVNLPDANTYIAFVTRFILAFGIAFLLPVFLVGLNTAGVLPARVMIKGWRVAVMVIFVFAALMSPSPDAWSMLALAFPMVGLFYLACGISAILDRRKKKDRPQWLDVPDDHASTM
ncbi:twin-arginine translocase subunit TatC [Calidifontibacter indicus]|uniref:Sec-independent protein translocase protein TatC n=1 Tax=Calidifontibacter indicus TaxID=419650 RepID=A0A3D9UT52_9MICO|nr:twin-arginine translocase subunit TatC [Calidifontibacter indicus]REF31160.1 sec-independent protein translocase protein TatC [Calidifontibacter indicus]